MPVRIVTKRENHLRPKEIGRVTCRSCGSDLQAERSDFLRARSGGYRMPVDPHTRCPVCDAKLMEAEFAWSVLDEALEARAQELHAQSQANLHNLHVRLWQEISEAERETWRARAR